MQQGHATTRMVAAATTCVCTKYRNGERTSTILKVLPHPFTASSTSCLLVEQIATTYSP